MEDKIYTSRKRNEAGQRAIDCIHYMSLDIDKTCAYNFDDLCRCRLRTGETCNLFEKGVEL
jgi:hypothetical protein